MTERSVHVQDTMHWLHIGAKARWVKPGDARGVRVQVVDMEKMTWNNKRTIMRVTVIDRSGVEHEVNPLWLRRDDDADQKQKT